VHAFEPRQPGRGYSWAPFTEGHTKSMRHGAKSERQLSPLVDAFLEHLAEVAQWSTLPAFRPTVEAWAWAEARAELYRRHFDDVGLGLVDEEPPPGLAEWERAEGRAQRLRAELGLSPSSLTKLLRGLSSIDGPAATAGLDALKAAGAEIRRAAEQAALPTGTDDQGKGDDGHQADAAGGAS
jgi:hypothetical protein